MEILSGAALHSICSFVSKKLPTLLTLVLMSAAFDAVSAVTFEKKIKISNKGLFFDGRKVASGAANSAKYDYFFGNRITPHGDCIKEHNGFVFLTWYRGGESDRHVMLSRYNTKTGVIKTIEFPHRHTGYLNQPHIGESHNTIAVGISPKDGSIHLLYDMHSYSENRPRNGAFSDDFFRYSFSRKGAANVADEDFNLSQFVNSNKGNYKHLQMRNGVNYKSLTYPNFFTNKEGDLFMWIREGGNNNGAYKFAKYDGNSWSDFTQFNILNAKREGLSYNWGLYGDIKFESGKMRIGFSRRANISTDAYALNNGFYYGVSDDPLGANNWKNYKGEGFSLPLINPEKLKISEPGNVLNVSGKDSIRMGSGADWTVTDDGDIHFVSRASGGGKSLNVHTYKTASSTNFKTTTSFPGGNLYTYDDNVYLIGLDAGRIFIERTAGGQNNWVRIYNGPATGTKYRHGNVLISKGKLYFYLMERASGSAQPIYLEIIDLGLEPRPTNSKPSLRFSTPSDGATFDAPASVLVRVESSDPDAGDSVQGVKLFLNGNLLREERVAPYIWQEQHDPALVNMNAGTYTLEAEARDSKGATTKKSITFTVRRASAPNPTPVPVPTAVPTNEPTPTPASCVSVNFRERAEVSLSGQQCIEFSRALRPSNTLQVWDSDVSGACDFRGTVAAIDGAGSLTVNRNYVSTTGLSGRQFSVRNSGSNNCKRVKVRAY